MHLKLSLLFLGLVLITSCQPPGVKTDAFPVLSVTPQANRGVNESQPSEVSIESVPTASATSVIDTPPTLTAVPTIAHSRDPVIIAADDSRIQYTGRFDFSDPLRPYFDWSGVSIKAAFSGPSLSILLADENNFYNVTIDGRSQILQTSPDMNRYLIAEALADGPHLVELTKRTEAYVGSGVFSGFVLAAGHDLLQKPDSAGRHIEFIGDSITTGYGNEGDSPQCWFTPATQNIAGTFAAQTAAHFGADYSIVALSGLGVVRNLRSSTTDSTETAIDFLNRSVAMNSAAIWEELDQQPDAVVVNLGTNDFSSLPFPERAAFEDAYVELLQAIRLRNPAAPIFSLAGPLMLGPAPNAILTAVESMRLANKDENVHFLLIEDTLEESAVDFGCDWHPNVNGHRKITAQLVPVMADVLGW